MSKNIKSVSALLIAGALALTACTSAVPEVVEPTTPEQSEAEAIADDRESLFEAEQEQGEVDENIYPGELLWASDMGGALYRVTIDSDGPEHIELLREQVGGDPVIYAVVDIDNREGTDFAYSLSLTAYDEDGQTYHFTSLDTVISEWQSPLDYGDPLYSELDEHWMENYYPGAEAGQVTSVALTYTGTLPLPDKFSSATIESVGAIHPVRNIIESELKADVEDFVVPPRN